MRLRASNAGAEMSIDAEEAALIKGMLVRGDKQQWIVAWFGGEHNSGRIADINTGKKWSEIKPAKAGELPPPGRMWSLHDSENETAFARD